MEDQSKKKPVKNSEKNNLAKKAMYKKKCVEQDYSDLIEIIKNYQKILSDDSFLMGAIKEMYEIQYLIVKKSSRNLLNQLFSCMTVSSAHDIAIQFINSLLIDNSDYSNIFDNP